MRRTDRSSIVISAPPKRMSRRGPADPYAHLAQRFVDHYDTLRGALRYELLSSQLDAHLPEPPQRVVDIGGGAGHQSIRLARAGYDVTLVDPSAAMLAHARSALTMQPAKVAARVRLLEARADQALGVLAGELFDVVLCHAVLPYVDDAPRLLDTLAQLARPRAWLSLVFKNADALAMRPALEKRWTDAAAAFDATEDVGGMGEPTRAHRRGDVEVWLRDAGFDPNDWYGIRIVTDHLADRPVTELSAVLPVETEASHRDPYRALGRLIHVLATRL